MVGVGWPVHSGGEEEDLHLHHSKDEGDGETSTKLLPNETVLIDQTLDADKEDAGNSLLHIDPRILVETGTGGE